MNENQAIPSVVQPESVAKLLDSLPGLVGALDKAIMDTTGRRMPFAVLVFADGAGMHASNFNAADTVKAIKDLVEAWEKNAATTSQQGGEHADTGSGGAAQ